MDQNHSARPRLEIEPLNNATSIRGLVYSRLKKAITEFDVYDHTEEIRLDERKLSEELDVSRTPVREALTLLEQEGFVRSVPRRGVFIVRKSKDEIVDMVIAWAALESMAARLATRRASDDEISELHEIMRQFENDRRPEQISEYSEANIAFHQKIIELGRSQVILDTTRNFFIHVRGIRKMTIVEDDRAECSVSDHMNIIRAIEARDPDRAGLLVREHTLGLAAHVDKHGDSIDLDRRGRTAKSVSRRLAAERRAGSRAIMLKIRE